jgi:hypothetical protein
MIYLAWSNNEYLSSLLVERDAMHASQSPTHDVNGERLKWEPRLLVLRRHDIDIDTHQPVIVFWLVRKTIYESEKPWGQDPKPSV